MKPYVEEVNYCFHNHSLKVIITRKAKKRLSYRAQSGVLLVSSPFMISTQTILEGIDQLPNSFINKLFQDADIGEDYIYLLGVKHRLVPVGIENRLPGDISFKNQEDLQKRLKSLAKEIITERVRYYEGIMNIDQPYKIRIQNVHTRYGSNSRKTHSLLFALVLIHYPKSVIDAVVVHELAHHYYFDHSRDFYNMVCKYYPNYYQEIKRLKGGHQ